MREVDLLFVSAECELGTQLADCVSRWVILAVIRWPRALASVLLRDWCHSSSTPHLISERDCDLAEAGEGFASCCWPHKPVRGAVTRFFVWILRVSAESLKTLTTIVHHPSFIITTTTNQQRPANCNNRQPRPPPTLFVFIVPTVCCLHRPNCARTNAARRNDHHRLTMALSPCPCPANKYHPTMSFCTLVACCLISCVPLYLDLD